MYHQGGKNASFTQSLLGDNPSQVFKTRQFARRRSGTMLTVAILQYQRSSGLGFHVAKKKQLKPS